MHNDPIYYSHGLHLRTKSAISPTCTWRSQLPSLHDSIIHSWHHNGMFYMMIWFGLYVVFPMICNCLLDRLLKSTNTTTISMGVRCLWIRCIGFGLHHHDCPKGHRLFPFRDLAQWGRQRFIGNQFEQMNELNVWKRCTTCTIFCVICIACISEMRHHSR